jgi:hypothetical protein
MLVETQSRQHKRLPSNRIVAYYFAVPKDEPLHCFLPARWRIFVIPLFVLAAAVFITSCGSRTRVDKVVPSPDGDTRLGIIVFGAVGRSYIEQTEKEVSIYIVRGVSTNETILFQHSYHFTASDLFWNVSWNSTNAVTVQLYDWGKGISGHLDLTVPTNHIATLNFNLDKQTGKFSEQPK